MPDSCDVQCRRIMQISYTQNLPRGLARLWSQHSCVLLQRLQHTVADKPVDPLIAQFQSKTEAELAELGNADADDTVRAGSCAGSRDAARNCRASPCNVVSHLPQVTEEHREEWGGPRGPEPTRYGAPSAFCAMMLRCLLRLVAYTIARRQHGASDSPVSCVCRGLGEGRAV